MIRMKESASTGRMVLVVLAVLLGFSVGLGALLGMAALTSRPPPYESSNPSEGYEGPP